MIRTRLGHDFCCFPATIVNEDVEAHAPTFVYGRRGLHGLSQPTKAPLPARSSAGMPGPASARPSPRTTGTSSPNERAEHVTVDNDVQPVRASAPGAPAPPP